MRCAGWQSLRHDRLRRTSRSARPHLVPSCPRQSYAGNNTRTSDHPFHIIRTPACDYAARPEPCRKPPGAPYAESGAGILLSAERPLRTDPTSPSRGGGAQPTAVDRCGQDWPVFMWVPSWIARHAVRHLPPPAGPQARASAGMLTRRVAHWPGETAAHGSRRSCPCPCPCPCRQHERSAGRRGLAAFLAAGSPPRPAERGRRCPAWRTRTRDGLDGLSRTCCSHPSPWQS
jgi:hypothetical protein